jgi:PIF1-like helicase
LEDDVDVHSKIQLNSGRADLIRAASLIVWEELPSIHKRAFQCAHQISCAITNNFGPFGNIPFVGVGDFRQVAPVVKGYGSTPSVLASIKSSSLWSQFRILSLGSPIRGEQDPEYTFFVDNIGQDFANEITSVAILETVFDLADAVDFLYPANTLRDPSTCIKHAFLSPKNDSVDEFNLQILERVAGDEFCYYSADSVKEDETDVENDYLYSLTHNGIPPHVLRLKKGTICAVMRNLSVREGLVKNARVIVENLHRRFVEVRVIDNRTGRLGKTHCIPRINFEFYLAHASWTVLRKQIPLRLAYACTFNGCLGLTLDKSVLDLRSPVFAHGQLYTALSRVRRREDSRVLLLDEFEKTTRNVVYKDMLL